jgi:hypothetical protein
MGLRGCVGVISWWTATAREGVCASWGLRVISGANLDDVMLWC